MQTRENKIFPLPEEDSIKLKKIDYVEFYVGNAKQAAYFYCKCFGFRAIAYAGLETGMRDRSSYVVAQSNIRFVFTSALTPEGPVAEYVRLHGDGVYNIALQVDDARACFATAIARGAQPILEPTIFQEQNGYLVKATIKSYSGDLVHSFIERHNYSNFAPQYQPIANISSNNYAGLFDIDHIVINVELGKMDLWADFYCKVLDLQESQLFTSDDISTKYSSLMSKVLQNNTGQIRFPINEPAAGYRKSQIQEYLDFHYGPGVQHIALRTNNIVKAVTELRNHGVEFLETPDIYYENLQQRIGQIDEDIETLRELKILLDRDEKGYLLQIFTKPLVTRPTFFIEIIQRKGAQGLGNGNFKALFEAIEREQAARGNLLPFS
ncbi:MULTISPECIES: 4-hydroxyphenylpyruvate dioxygenase [unclassified Tolypothrix]|uniref:4-hydroxyphenylpyruvate dioxygenase n=1 Tax=unclassified Tolypothrix TaxID=2649714 RepID=UPI0005F80640|nr:MULTISPECIES: 4-hydroxyphenylpyruvate dioxygenase [unclassified Tolypothrix]MBE9086815.1 4-hydroxyphenylpyruvate dioxygenase [Tolypothrix sp. LEGE 11397]UYD25197.1 4-hydroxyphenylpyruvate dioxygenase [Tolypothrix sp. PCC 7712]UYD32565.1 4-hydroxyphenylpyruvate dioxygenase [Tolypothrix sp. PCC 7601]BAY91099.1 4-hydroxyphenylpyruvate dioxygenase [Microchaete diplosiphon NIES-3275]